MTRAIGSCRKCGREVGEVHVGDTVLYGHLQAPHPSHRVIVRLSRSGVGTSPHGQEDSRRQTGVPEVPAGALTCRTLASCEPRRARRVHVRRLVQPCAEP